MKTVHVAVRHDAPLDEKIVGCFTLTCETIIGLSEEYRLAEFCRMQWLFRFRDCIVTDACECFVQMCAYGYPTHNHGSSGRILWLESSPRTHGLGRSPWPCVYSGLTQP